MKKTAIAMAALIAVGAAGCAQRQVPAPASYPASSQQKMQATHHWDVLAANLAEGISGKLSSVPGNRPVYITPSSAGSEFGKALQGFLTTRLLERGVVVTTSGKADQPCQPPCGPLQLKYDSQIVAFNSREKLLPLPDDFTVMKGVSYLIYRIGDLWAAPAWGILPLSDYQEEYMPEGTSSEVIVNVTINDGAKVLYSGSSVYYINDGEKSHYSGPGLPPVTHTKSYKMVDQQ